ncbi:unnamed protein product [Ilex paraguariensis]|uniref:Major facilitator superfamily (MFS) profile domain-containing protein n=1 Tax=Ilex paraguariensis TaxID=185542 RepID=A0ABC8UBF5_9AQUA
MFDSQRLTKFTSSFYLNVLLSSLASYVTGRLGRKLSMLFGGLLFLARAFINGFAQAVWMLYLGRILLGLGIGFANQLGVAFELGRCYGPDPYNHSWVTSPSETPNLLIEHGKTKEA